MLQYLVAGYLPDDFDPSAVAEAMVEKIHAFDRGWIAAGERKFAWLRSMRKTFVTIAFGGFALLSLLTTTWRAQAQDGKTPYPSMAPLEQYLMEKGAEIALARTAAPVSVSESAEVMVLGPAGYATAAQGSNGFVCLVERSWGAATDEPEFWNPKVRSPICFNSPAARSFLPLFLMKTKLVLEGKSKAEVVQAMGSALDKKEVPALEQGAMCYMLSKQQYLNDRGKSWHPHLMFLIPGDTAKSWGANLTGSPVIAANDPEERATIFMVWVGAWSDETPAPPISH